MKSVILIAVMAVVTILLRFLPFLVFRKKTPPYITYLGSRRVAWSARRCSRETR